MLHTGLAGALVIEGASGDYFTPVAPTGQTGPFKLAPAYAHTNASNSGIITDKVAYIPVDQPDIVSFVKPTEYIGTATPITPIGGGGAVKVVDPAPPPTGGGGGFFLPSQTLCDGILPAPLCNTETKKVAVSAAAWGLLAWGAYAMFKSRGR